MFKTHFQVNIPKNMHEIIRVSIDEYGRKKMLTIRDWYRLHADDEFSPSKKGIVICISKYPELMKALEEACEHVSVD